MIKQKIMTKFKIPLLKNTKKLNLLKSFENKKIIFTFFSSTFAANFSLIIVLHFKVLTKLKKIFTFLILKRFASYSAFILRVISLRRP